MTNINAHPTAQIGPERIEEPWLLSPAHSAWLRSDAERQFAFFRKSLRPEGGFCQLDAEGNPRTAAQELFVTTRMVHSYALGTLFGFEGCTRMIDHGMRFICDHHLDRTHGGYVWSLSDNEIQDDRKSTYGHVFVLLAAATAKQAGHPEADALLKDATEVLLDRFWDEAHGAFADEASRDWIHLSPYRGFNANMHAVEALLAAFEATQDTQYLGMAERILRFFIHGIAPKYHYRVPEHFTENWQVDEAFQGDPMFKPSGTTPGHSFEIARLVLHHWDLSGRQDPDAVLHARKLVDRALSDAWDHERGGLFYTLRFDGTPDIRNRYWWPVTEAIGVLAALLKLEHNQADEIWYRRLWTFADKYFIDHEFGGWHPEIDKTGRHSSVQFKGKPDIYHSVQASLFPLSERISGMTSR